MSESLANVLKTVDNIKSAWELGNSEMVAADSAKLAAQLAVGLGRCCASNLTLPTPDESRWAIVVVDSEVVHTSKFQRSGKMDILASHEIQPEHKAKSAEGFDAANCSSVDKAAITKIEHSDRVYLIVGAV